MPVKGKSGILSIYKFVFSRNDVENVEYKVDSINKIGKLHYEYGELATRKVDHDNIYQTFKAVFEKQNNDFKILEISFRRRRKIKKGIAKIAKTDRRLQSWASSILLQ